MFFNSSITKKKLLNNEIHLWYLDPQKINEQFTLDSLKTLLSEAELEKVARYRLPKAQHDALITRAFIRSVLALYTDINPQDLEFKKNKHGKPELNHSLLPVRFNLSHNDKLIICAVCLKHNIGCDVESLYRKICINNIAKRYFSSDEYQSLLTLSPKNQQTRFFELWTLKEAFVKATGKGISQGLDTFSFQIGVSKKPAFNDNISLKLVESGHLDNCDVAKSPLENSQQWYSSLSYLDNTHCIAICVNSTKKLNIEYFQANDYLS